MKKKAAVVRIDSYFVDGLIIGKVRSVGQLKSQMMEVLGEIMTSDFLSIFCARYNFEILHNDQEQCVGYVMDLDTYLVYKPY